MELAEYQQRFANVEDAAPGWDAITERLTGVYGDQEPRHWGTVVKYAEGGPDPIDGISAYECKEGGRDHLHFCSYGFTSLYYDEEAVGGEFNGYGFELTFRLATSLPPAEDPVWVGSLMQNLARYVFKTGKCFAPGHWIPANGPIRGSSDTAIVGLAFVADPTLPAIDSPHGLVEFVQMFGLTQSELDQLKSKAQTCEQIVARHRQHNPLLITDLARKDL
jgi:hypothetical protein